MKQKTKKILCFILTVLMTISVTFGSVMNAFAASDGVKSTANGVFKFQLCLDDEVWGTGTCFLVNDNTIVTANHCVAFSSEFYEEFYDEYGMTRSQVNEHLSYNVVISRDLTIPCTLLNSSENMDFAILKLDQDITGHTPLTLRDSTTVEVAETVYSVGFPGTKESSGIDDSSDVAFETGVINKAQYTDSFYMSEYYYSVNGEMLLFSGDTSSEGNSGGPLVDENGNVIGVCIAGSNDGANSYASASSQVMSVLDSLGLSYKVAKSSNAGLKVAVGVGLAVIIIAGIAVVVIVLTKKKKKGANVNQGVPTAGNMVPPTANQNVVRPAQPMQAQSRPAQPMQAQPRPAQPMPSQAAKPAQPSFDSQATTVLNQFAPKLIKKQTGEIVSLRMGENILGREQQNVTYCISNINVSRVHAKINVRNGQAFIVDNNASNGTFINGRRLAPFVEEPIPNGAEVTLADEKFTYQQ